MDRLDKDTADRNRNRKTVPGKIPAEEYGLKGALRISGKRLRIVRLSFDPVFLRTQGDVIHHKVV